MDVSAPSNAVELEVAAVNEAVPEGEDVDSLDLLEGGRWAKFHVPVPDDLVAASDEGPDGVDGIDGVGKQGIDVCLPACGGGNGTKLYSGQPRWYDDGGDV